MAVSAKNYRFVSPGIVTQEIDRSRIPNAPAPIGPVIIGRSQRGPAMRPVTVQSYDEFIKVFGEPLAGGDSSGDVWRSGIPTGPTYAPYAAQANQPSQKRARINQPYHDAVALAQKGGYSYAEIAKEVGRAVATVQNYLKDGEKFYGDIFTRSTNAPSTYESLNSELISISPYFSLLQYLVNSARLPENNGS